MPKEKELEKTQNQSIKKQKEAGEEKRKAKGNTDIENTFAQEEELKERKGRKEIHPNSLSRVL